MEVFFDDFKVNHTPSKIVQKDDYYPGGLTFNSYTSGTENLYKYNGKEEQKELGTYDYGARMYDPALMRWNRIDNLADKYFDISPYVYALNNPIIFIDPDGNDVEVVHLTNYSQYEGAYDKAKGHTNSRTAAAFSAFVQTEQGRRIVAQYARAGDVIGGLNLTKMVSVQIINSHF